jgi:hypothetical protein
MISTEEWIRDKGLRNEILIGSRTKPIYLDALLDEFKTELVKKLTIPVVVGRSEQLKCNCKKATFTRTVDENYNPTCGKCGKTL